MRNNENHIFIDTNCLIGFLCEKYNLSAVSGTENTEALHYLHGMNGKKLYVSSLAIAQLTAKLQNKLNKNLLTEEIKQILHKFNIVEFNKKDIEEALNSPYAKDIEDLYQYKMSEKAKCLYLMTNNVKDFATLLNVIPFKPKQVRMMNLR